MANLGIELELSILLTLVVLGAEIFAPFEVETPVWKKIPKIVHSYFHYDRPLPVHRSLGSNCRSFAWAIWSRVPRRLVHQERDTSYSRNASPPVLGIPRLGLA